MAGSDSTERNRNSFTREIAGRFGVMPNFFCSAPAATGLIEELWAFAKSAYLDSPLPSVSKERLFVHLSRFCEVRYCIVRHVGFLIGEGRPAGDAAAPPETVEQVIDLLSRPLPDATALDEALSRLEAHEEPAEIPAPRTQAESDLFDALTVMFVEPRRSARARDAVRRAVGAAKFEILTAYLAFVRTAHYWTETHPDLAYETDMAAVIERRPDLARLLLDPSDAERVTAGAALRQALEELQEIKGSLREKDAVLQESEAQYRALFDSIDEGFCVIERIADDPLDFRYLQANPAFAAQSGVDDVVGRTIRQVVPGETENWFETYDRVARTGQPIRFERDLVTQGRVLELYAFPVPGGTGGRVGVIFKDVTQRKRAEEALRDSEERYRLLFTNMIEGFALAEMMWDEQGEPVDWRYLEVNKAWEQTGIPVSRTVGRTAREVNPSIEPGWIETYGRVVQTGQPAQYEAYAVGFGKWFETFAYKHSENRFGLLFRDVTDRKRAEEALREREEKYRTLFDSIDEGLALVEMIYDDHGEIVDMIFRQVNAAYERQGGIYNVVGRSVSEMLPGVEDVWLERFKQVARSGQPIRVEDYQQDVGRWFDVYFSRVDTNGRFVAIVFADISERRRAEEVLRESEERQAFLLRFTDALRGEPNEDAIVDRALRMLAEELALDRCYATTMYPDEDRVDVTHEIRRPDLAPMPSPLRFSDFPEAGRQTSDRTLIFNDTANDPELTETDKSALAAMSFGALLSRPLRRGAANPIWAVGAVSSRPRRWTPGEIALVEEVAERTWDAAERARAEAALRESEARFRQLVTLMPAAVYTCDAEGRITFYNRQAVELWGREPPLNDDDQKFCGTLGMWGGDGQPVMREDCPMAEAVIEGRPTRDREVVFERPGGERLVANVNIDPLHDPTGRRVGAINVFTDVTDRKRAENLLRESEERQAFLLKLSDALRPLAGPADIQGETARLLREQLNAAWCYYVDWDLERQIGLVLRDSAREGLPSLAGEHDVFDAPELLRFLADGAVRTVSDYANYELLPPRIRQNFVGLGFRSMMMAPLVKEGRLIATPIVGDTEIRDWSASEASLLVEAAERTWAAIERARAEQALRDIEARHRKTLEIETVGVVYFDFAGGITDANDAFLAMVGYTRAELEAGEVRYENLTPPDWAWRDEQTIRELQTAGRGGPFEKQYFRRDGSRMWILCASTMLDHGSAVEFVIDVSDRRQAEIALRESEQALASDLANAERLRSLSERLMPEESFQAIYDEVLSATVAITGADAGTVQIYDPATKSLELIASLNFSRKITDYFHRVDAGSRTACGIALKTGERAFVDFPDEVADLGCQLLTDEGIQSAVAVPLMSRTGVPLGMLNAHWRQARHRLNDSELRFLDLLARQAADLIEQRRSQSALRESEEQFRRSVMDAPIPVIMHAEDGEVLQISRSWTELTGYTIEDSPVIQDWLTRAYGFGGESVRDAMEGAFAPLQADRPMRGVVFEITTRQGERRQWSFSASSPGTLSDGRRFVIGMAEDITERTRAEAALRENEERLCALLDNLPGGAAFIVDSSLRYVLAKGEAMAAAGLRPEDLVGRTIFEALPPDVAAAYEPHYRRALAGEPFEVEHTDHGLSLVSRGVPLKTGEGKPGSVLVVSYDITARKQAEEALRESEERFRQFGEASSDVLWIRSAETLQWEYLSPAFEAIYGEARDKALAGDTMKRWAELIVPEDREHAIGSIRRVFEGDQVTFEYRIRRPSDGEVRWLRNTDFPIKDEAGRVPRIGGIGQDITEAKEAEDRMQVLVAELQHRTRNLIAVVRSLADKTRQESASLDDFQARYGDRLQAVARVQGLLSRLGEGQRVAFDELLHAELRAHGALDGNADRATLEGPAGVRLRSGTVQTFALALHELATNAAKYGALSQPDGHLTVRWRVETDGAARQLHVDWRESGVAMPADAAPQGGGYGRELIERALPYQLKAKTTYELGPEGVRCTISVPISEAVQAQE